MATINKAFESDALALNLDIQLCKRILLEDDSTQYYALVLCSFDGGRRTCVKEVLLDELSAPQKSAAIATAQALHALALPKVTAEDL